MRFAILVTLLSSVSVLAAPVPARGGIARRAFQEQAYAAFQISDTPGGTALADANAVFVDPFQGQDLATVSAADLASIQTMREAAESAETDDFNPQIAAAAGTAADALSVGKIKNKVLKLTGEVQGINIKIAQGKAAGDDTSDDEASLAVEQKKLDNNISLDKANAGKTSKGVA